MQPAGKERAGSDQAITQQRPTNPYRIYSDKIVLEDLTCKRTVNWKSSMAILSEYT